MQRRSAVSKCPQYGCTEIKKHLRRNPCKNNTQIQEGHRPNLLRGPQKCQHRIQRQLCRCRKQQCQNHTQRNGMRRRLFEMRIFLCPEILCQQNRKALCNCLHNAQHHIVIPVRSTQRSKRIHAQHSADNQRIRNCIELLKHISKHQGNCKKEDQFSRFSLCHTLNFCTHTVVTSDSAYYETDPLCNRQPSHPQVSVV